MTFLKGCNHFSHLLSEAEDRALTTREKSFLASHKVRCPKCREAERSLRMSLNMLRAATLTEEAPRSFDKRVIRRVQVQQVKDSFSYWTPTFVGSLLAFLIVFASVDVLAARRPQSKAQLGQGTAMRDGRYPVFELHQIPRFER